MLNLIFENLVLIEILSFEMFDFGTPYHAIFERPVFPKFMVVPHLAYHFLMAPSLFVVTSSNLTPATRGEL